MDTFAGKTAFVTGAASGIGLGICRRALKLGMNVMMADIEVDALHEAAADLSRGDGGHAGARIETVICDVSLADEVDRAAQATIEAFGSAHLICNNAGISTGGLIDECEPGDWDWAISVNLKGVINGCRAFLPILKAQTASAHFVNSASMAGLVDGMPGWGPYQTTKYAIIGLTMRSFCSGP